MGDNPSSMSVHILGPGNIGCLIAHSLKTLSRSPDVTLLFHRQQLVRHFLQTGGIRLKRNDSITLQEGFNYEILGMDIKELLDNKGSSRSFNILDSDNRPIDSESIISKLIVTSKAQSVVPAISNIRHRLRRSSTICLLHNGMGVLEKLNKEVFSASNERPNLLVGITDHGCYQLSRFYVNHVGLGSVTLGLANNSEEISQLLGDGNTESVQKAVDILSQNPDTKSTAELLQTLTSIAVLGVNWVPYETLLKQQIFKLVVNASINPLTALLKCQNGELIKSEHFISAMRSVVSECCNVLAANEHTRNCGGPSGFDPDIMLKLVMSVARRTGQNKSSMYQDLESSRSTEIDFINGYISDLGRSVNVPTPVNDMLSSLIRGYSYTQQNLISSIPLIK